MTKLLALVTATALTLAAAGVAQAKMVRGHHAYDAYASDSGVVVQRSNIGPHLTQPYSDRAYGAPDGW